MRVICSVCAHEVPFGTLGRCPNCNGILRPDYPDEAVAQLARIHLGRGIDRYRPTLPISTNIVNLGEGDTPLLTSQRLGKALGLSHLYFKHEGLNPSGAFKDRAGAMVAALAREAGAKGVLTASSGNASSAISAYCAAAGLKCAILLEPGNPPAKIRQTLAMGAQVLPVAGVFAHGPQALADLLFAVAAQTGYYVGFVWAPVNPYILEGIKTISYEITMQLPGVPDVVIGPAGGGDMFAAQWRGYLELKRAGVIDRLPRMIAVQSVSAPPLLEAFNNQVDHVPTLPYARSKISGINVPFTGDHALAAIRESGGLAIGITDEEALTMQARMGIEEGIWVEPAGAVTVAALSLLIEKGEISSDQRVVCILSGAGFKDTHLAEVEANTFGQREAIPLDVEAICRILLN